MLLKGLFSLWFTWVRGLFSIITYPLKRITSVKSSNKDDLVEKSLIYEDGVIKVNIKSSQVHEDFLKNIQTLVSINESYHGELSVKTDISKREKSERTDKDEYLKGIFKVSSKSDEKEPPFQSYLTSSRATC